MNTEHFIESADVQCTVHSAGHSTPWSSSPSECITRFISPTYSLDCRRLLNVPFSLPRKYSSSAVDVFRM
jgi:hypothetical protein